MASIPLRDKINRIDKLVDLARREMPRIQDNLILRTTDGYSVFGIYRMRKRQGRYQVLKGLDPRGEFGSRKTALAWCIADKYQQLNLARRIQQLDQQYQYRDKAVELRRQCLKTNDSRQDWLSSKIQYREQQRKDNQAELQKCVNLAKYLQIRGFQDDTQRNFGPRATKTSR
jgi:hypothetical protein